jgi:hypothetical protein
MTTILLLLLHLPARHHHCRTTCPGGQLYCYGKCLSGMDVPDKNPAQP